MTVKCKQISEGREALRERLIKAIEEAATLISPAWPLQTAISVNPFTDATHLPIEQALWQFDAARNGAHFPEHLSLVESTNAHLIKWMAPYIDQGQSALPMPDRHLGFYSCWKGLALHDESLENIAELPEDPREAILEALDYFEVDSNEWVSFLQFHLVQLPGWAGCAKWHGQQDESGLNLVEFLAARLCIAKGLPAKISTPRDTRSTSSILSQIEEAEKPFIETLEGQLASISKTEKPQQPATYQWVFCIDVRSEPMRRKIEALPSHETFGFAGFFNVPIKLNSPCGEKSCHSAPVILNSEHEVSTRLEAKNPEKVAKKASFMRGSRKLYKTVKSSFLAPFVLAEAMGPFAGAAMCLQTLKPGVMKEMGQRFKGKASTVPNIDASAIEFKTQVDWARGALMGMGLTKHFGEVVIICGHAATTTNNPHHSALQCGACGGNPGGGNAQVLCTILNDPKVRAELANEEIQIPETTWFVAAEHNTTTDTIHLLSPAPQTPSQRDLLKSVEESCETVSDVPKEQHLKASDWAQVRPEWGLARNGAILIGRRSLSQHLDLDGRAFLHSYNPEIDPDGAILAGILSGPLLVAQWINTQYLFSTADPSFFGGGNKTVNQVVGKIGVMQGCHSDLMHGLPFQSVYSGDETPYHEPIRLSTVIEADRSVIEKHLETHEGFRSFVKNQWIHLYAIDPKTEEVCHYEANGNWRSL